VSEKTRKSSTQSRDRTEQKPGKSTGRKRGRSGGGATDQDALKRYREKRHFGRTAEPRGEGETSGDGGARFVVQIHDATTMHFDFRLEVEGVLKSWSVPKGPSPDPHEKRLAMPTEDHPLEYREFEGVIAPGEYGAGTVIVWDEGTYRPHSENFAEALRHGHATFRLAGAKLRGGYALTRFRGGGDGDREAWLLVKQNDERAVRDGRTPDPMRARSAHTGRTLRQVAAEDGGA
jgi:DNA ligase D-like protein (predicted 3'-phosphoesterase)